MDAPWPRAAWPRASAVSARAASFLMAGYAANADQLPLPVASDLRRAARQPPCLATDAFAQTRRRPGADAAAAPPPQQGAHGQPDLPSGWRATRDHRSRRRQPAIPPRTSRSAATRRRRPSSRPSSTASPRRPSAWAATAPASSRCSTANSAQCGPVNNQIQQMRGNLDQITTSLERLRSGGSAAPTARTSAARC